MQRGPHTTYRLAAVIWFTALVGFSPTPAAGQPLARESLARVPDSLPCWDCGRRRQPGVSLLEMQFGMWPQWAVNKFLRPGNIGDVNPAFWWRNVRRHWDWDPNSFDINQLGHPAQGSMYFNGWRTNGYGFWGSQLGTLGGSFFWECCGERNFPSNNDLLTTWLGGATLGEVGRRLSDIWLDNSASGTERLGREAASFAVNPVRGLDRIIRGHAWARGANPPGVQPAWLQGVVGVGGVVLEPRDATNSDAVGGAKIAARLGYGRPDAALGKPFDLFDIEAELTTVMESRIHLVRSRGSLFARRIGGRRDTSDVLASFLRFDYVRNRAFELGQQTVTLAWERKRKWSERLHLTGEFNLRAIPIAAIQDDFLTPFGENRNYDYAAGIGYGSAGRAIWRGRAHLRWHSTHEYLRVVDGEASSHVVARYEVYGQYELGDLHGVGLGLRYYSRQTSLRSGARKNADVPELWISLVRAYPRWTF